MESLCLWLYMLLFLAQYPTGFSLINNNNTSMNHHVCLEDERQVLLQLKKQLSPAHPQKYYKTLYWKESRDCCGWDGVACDYFTGHVISLDLSYNHHFRSSSRLSGELKTNSSLFHLTHLRRLNLAYNNFQGCTIPSEFARLNALTHLNLSHAGFGGEIPMEFYHLSNLLSLDIMTEEISLDKHKIRCDVKMLFGNMTRLRALVLTNQHLVSELPMNMPSFLTHLDLGNTGLQGELPATIFEKPNMQVLELDGNPGLKGSLPESFNWSNVHSIKKLDLSETSISGRVPDSIGLMTKLNYMDLSHCRFSGPIPEYIGNITGITSMDLSYNEFSGRLPSTISNLRHVTLLDLSSNHLEGQLPDAFSGFQNLTHLDLSNNYLKGLIPSSLTNISQLIHLDISSNAFTGPFPSTVGHGLQKLYKMDFSDNSIQGTIPPWLFSLPSLYSLDLSSNKLTGRIGKLTSQTLAILYLNSNGLNIELESFYNLTNIEQLRIAYNTVTEHDGDVVNVTFPNLWRLDLCSCDIKELPNFLRSMPSLASLDLSNNKIHGPVPSFFTPEYLTYLNLSSNFLTYAGDLPWQFLQFLDLSYNSLSGTFPASICNMTMLSILNLSDNKLSGNIPECLANSTTSLGALDLRRNEFHGKIPTTFGSTSLSWLGYIGLNGNLLEGSLPRSLANCTQLEVIDLGNNMIQDTFPWWLHTLPNLKILILKSNSFHGSLTSPPFTNNSFTNLQIFDLSYNNFTGLLPEKLFATLQAIKNQSQVSSHDTLYMGANPLYEYSVTLSVKGEYEDLIKVFRVFTTIDLSSNNFIGTIPDSLSNLTSLRLLNLSHNSIHGSIPPALGRMTNLEQLDLSSNQLTGGIPQTLTNLTFLGALNLSHNHLVGPIPQGNQFLTFSNDSYAGNSGLCGAPLTRSCGDERKPPSAGDFEEEDGESGFMTGFTWKPVVMGYGCGIMLGFILGNVMISTERPRWLARFVYVEASIILSRRKKRRRTAQGTR